MPYEFAPRLSDTAAPEMKGGGLGPYEPGEYSDDTQMQAYVAELAALGHGLSSERALDGVAAWFLRWYREGAGHRGPDPPRPYPPSGARPCTAGRA